MIDRESVIDRSVVIFLEHQIFDIRSYPQDKVVFLDARPTSERMGKAIDRNYIAMGFQTDDGGRAAELGSSLRRRLYTLDFYVYGVSRVWAKNLASVIRFSLESEGNINLLDLNDGTTVIDNVIVDYVSAQQIVTPTPRPWEENAWIVRLRIEDYYNSSQGG